MKKRICILALLALLALCLPQAAWAEDYGWDAATATAIDLDGQSGVITIDAAGTYVLSGTLADGQILIAATKDDAVRLVLNGAHITSGTSAGIYASACDELIIILADGTENSVTDAAQYVYEDGADEPDAAIFAKDDLKIGGGGTLTVTGNYRNGIGTKDDLDIDGGTITVTAANDGLRGRDSVDISAGTITIAAGNDGIKSNNDEDAEKGWITIEGGSFAITAEYDGIQAETALTITGGTFDITAGGGSANAPKKVNDKIGGRGMMGAVAATDDATAESMKGIKAGGQLTLSGGTFVIDAYDDALHTNGDMTITGGEFTLSTGDDGAHADGALTITGGTIGVLTAYEGLEGVTVDISGGEITVIASDDGINAGGGSDESDAGTFFGPGRGGDVGKYSLTISGGSVTITTDTGDGIDSNGALDIAGGTITIYGPSGDPESAFDAEGTISVTGGVIAAASAAGNGEIPGTQTSTQPTIIVYYDGQQQGGTVTLTDAAGQTLATYTTDKAFASVWFSTPDIAQGETYTVTTDGGKATDITVTGVTMTVAEDGSETTPRGLGGFGGRGGGGWMMPEDGAMPEGRQRPEGGGTMPEGGMPPEGWTPPDGATPPDMPEGAPGEPPGA